MLARALVPLAFLLLATAAFAWSIHSLGAARDLHAALSLCIGALLLSAARRSVRILEGS